MYNGPQDVSGNVDGMSGINFALGICRNEHTNIGKPILIVFHCTLDLYHPYWLFSSVLWTLIVVVGVTPNLSTSCSVRPRHALSVHVMLCTSTSCSVRPRHALSLHVRLCPSTSGSVPRATKGSQGQPRGRDTCCPRYTCYNR